MIRKFTVSNDPAVYEAWPCVARTPSEKLVAVFAECTHHCDRSYTRIVSCESTDRGRTWSAKQPITEGTEGHPFYNCPRVTRLRDGRLAVLVDKLFTAERSADPEQCRNDLYFSEDEGATWSPPVETPARGIVPDKLLELESGRWIVACHYNDKEYGNLIQRLWYSDDQGTSWSDPVIVARSEGLNLCEVSILPVDGTTLVAFHRENTGLGWDGYKTISRDGGEHWSEPIRFPLPGCHRPVAGWLREGKVLITYRFVQGGGGWGAWTQNFFAALLDRDSVLALTRRRAAARILPIDYDRSPKSDLGYSGWVQFDDGEIYIVNYIVDDAVDKGQIRGYSLRMEDFLLPEA